jgi:hypothetical protein
MGKKIRTQADRRQHATLMDKEGRKWQAVIEKDTMHPCGVISPKGWRETTGCVVPDQYKTIPDLSDPFALVIDYDKWIEDLEAAHRDYEDRMQTTAMAMDPENQGGNLYRQGIDGSVYRSPSLVRIVGKPPAPIELVRAMRAGNKWSLGLINPATRRPWPRPSWAEKFFPAEVTLEDVYPDEFPDDDAEGDGDFESASEFPDDGDDEEAQLPPVLQRRRRGPTVVPIPRATPEMLATLPPEPAGPGAEPLEGTGRALEDEEGDDDEDGDETGLEALSMSLGVGEGQGATGEAIEPQKSNQTAAGRPKRG